MGSYFITPQTIHNISSHHDLLILCFLQPFIFFLFTRLVFKGCKAVISLICLKMIGVERIGGGYRYNNTGCELKKTAE